MPSHRRNDIEGLRALGALLVFVFHLWGLGVSGGVDIFFVVSGYFIANSYAGRAGAGQNVDVLRIYERFLVRIVPQAMVALIGIMVLAYAFTSPARWGALLRDIAFSAVYLENWWLIRKGTDYLARSEDISFAQHFWAISLIGQVYVLFPLLLALASGVARRFGACTLQSSALLIGGLSAASLAFSIGSTAADPASAYYSLFPRFWEFGVGFLLGLRLLPALRGRGATALLSWVGLLLTVSCGVVIGNTASFPGYAALWPVGAAALLLLAGREDDPRNAAWLLARPPLPLLGTLAFGIYLWHWPLYAILLEITQGAAPSLGQGALVLGITLGLAAAGKHLTERGSRVAERLASARAVAVASAAGLVAVAGSAAAVERFLLKEPRLAEAVLVGSGLALAPGPLSLRLELPSNYRSACHQSIPLPEVISCVKGKADGASTLVVVGGSRSAHWLPALEAIAEQADLRIVVMTKSACVFASGHDTAFWNSHRFDRSCPVWNEKALKAILDLQPEYVLTLATRDDRVPDGYIHHFRRLSERGVRVIALRDVPTFALNPATCLFSPWTTEPKRCGMARDAALKDGLFSAERLRLPGEVVLVDMSDAICDETWCDVARDGLVAYRDPGHLTASFSRTLAPLLWSRIQGGLGRQSASLRE